MSSRRNRTSDVGLFYFYIYAEEKVHRHQVVVILIRKFVNFADEIEVDYYYYVPRDLFLFIFLRKVVKHGLLWMEFLEWKLAPCFNYGDTWL
jgi:hypothetical protein